MIIDGKNIKGERVSASIDNFLWKLVCADFKTDSDARAWIRNLLSQDMAMRRPSAWVRNQCLYRIAKPSLAKRAVGLEGQMDIEEV